MNLSANKKLPTGGGRVILNDMDASGMTNHLRQVQRPVLQRTQIS
jgi:hypothetical protein